MKQKQPKATSFRGARRRSSESSRPTLRETMVAGASGSDRPATVRVLSVCAMPPRGGKPRVEIRFSDQTSLTTDAPDFDATRNWCEDECDARLVTTKGEFDRMLDTATRMDMTEIQTL